MKPSFSFFVPVLFLTFFLLSQQAYGKNSSPGPVTPAASTGSISGTVTKVPSGALSKVTVEVYSAKSQALVGSDSTDSFGAYSVGVLADGNYFVRTRNSAGYIDEMYNNKPCIGGSCSGITPTTVSVSGGGETSGINFALASGGSLSGTVTDADTLLGVSGVTVNVYDALGFLVAAGNTNGAGAYSVGQLPAGLYRARTRSSADYNDELYDDIACPGGVCDIGTGAGISVTAGADTAGIDFALTYGGSISGTIDSGSAPMPTTGSVLVFDAAGNLAGSSAGIEPTGTYKVTRLPSGTYTARTETPLTFEDKLYDTKDCPNGLCDVTSGNPITVLAGATTKGIHFRLQNVKKVSGRVHSADGYLEGVEVRLYSGKRDNKNPLFGPYDTDLTDAGGSFTLGGWDSDQAVVITSNSGGYVDELYDDITCPMVSCYIQSDLGVFFDLTSWGSNGTANFELEVGGSISGTVTAEATGDPLEGVEVIVDGYTATEDPVGSAKTDAAGAFTVKGLPMHGFYRVRTLNTSGYIDEVFDDKGCVPGGCATGKDAVAVALGVDTPGINFALARGGQISGKVIDGRTGTPLALAQIEIDNSGSDNTIDGRYPTLIVWSDVSGNYISPLLPAGTYTARTVYQSTDGYADEIWDNIPCEWALCDRGTGTPITVEADVVTTGIDFALLYGAITGTVTDAITDAPVTSGIVRVIDTTGEISSQGALDAQGTYLIDALPVGTYYVWSVINDGHINEVFDGVTCLNTAQCDKTSGTPVVVAGGVATTGIDFALMPGGTISGRLTSASTGQDVRANVDIWDSSGKLAAHAFNKLGSYVVTTLPAGNFTATASSAVAVYDVLYDQLRCDPGCDVTAGLPITVTAGAETSGIDFAFEVGGSISGQAIDQSTGSGIDRPGVVVHFYNQSGEAVGTSGVSQINAGSYKKSPLAAGSYFVSVTAPWRPGSISYLGEAYDNVPCQPDCDVTGATPVVVSPGVETSGINFELVPEHGIAALVHGVPPGNVSGSVLVFDTGGAPAGSCQIGAEDYRGCLVRGLVPGTYFVRTETDGYIDQLYDGISCPSGNCNVTTGTPVVLSAGVSTTIEFGLEPGSVTFTVGGSVTGLTGTGLVLQNNAKDDLAIGAEGDFTFATPLDDGSTYAVTVLTQPSGPAQACSVSGGSGTLTGADIVDVAVNCVSKSDDMFMDGFEE